MNQVRATERCSALSQALGEPQPGTAPYVERGYLVVEDPGPWGRSGIAECSLGEVGVELERRAKAAGLKCLLQRETGRTGRSASERRRVYAARHGHDRALAQVDVGSPDELLELDLSAFAGALTGIHRAARAVDAPLMLVCTHAKRDQCCAISGAPLARALAARHPGRVLECSHLGGHRFAPTAMVLPLGAMYGRLDERSAGQALEHAAGGRVVPSLLRGLSHLPPAAQAADVAVRLGAELVHVDAVRLRSAHEDGMHSRIAMSTDDGEWLAEVETHESAPRVQSCGKAPSTTTEYRVRALRAPGRQAQNSTTI